MLLTHASHPDPFEANGMPPTYDSMHLTHLQPALLFRDSRRLDKTSRAWTRHQTIPLSAPASRFLFESFVKRPRSTPLQPSNLALRVAESRTRRGQGACSKACCRGGEPPDRLSSALGSELACGGGAPWVRRSSRCLLHR